MIIVAGLSLKNLQPRVWDPNSEFFIPALSAVMVSYAEFHRMRAKRAAAMELGLHRYLGVPTTTSVYLDNGAFYFGTREVTAPFIEYEEFVDAAKPDWKPIPQDYIPFPSMSRQKQRSCYDKTMKVNLGYQHNGYVPVVHIGKHLLQFTKEISSNRKLARKPAIALGGIVPNLLRKQKAMSYPDILQGLLHVRTTFKKKSIHVFGVGGTSTLHLVSLLGFDSVDSSGWRNRAARGIVQLPGCGERLIAELGNWRGRRPSEAEWDILRRCQCPACCRYGLDGLKARKLQGFCCRATHNLWILLEEDAWLRQHISEGTYAENYEARVDNSVYLPVVKGLLNLLD